MSEQPTQDQANEPDTQPDEGTDGVPIDDTVTGADDTQGDDESGDEGREAARYRRRLRQTERERDAIADQLVTVQRGAAEHIAEQNGVNAAALWASGAELSDLLDEAGAVDATKVRDAADDAVERLGLSRPPRPDPTQGRASTGGSLSWADAIRPSP